MFKQCIIIGVGPAGTAAALAAKDLGVGTVLLVEGDALGGTCTNRGCIPTKFLLSRTEVPAIPTREFPVAEWPRLIAHKNALVRGLSRSIEAKLQERGVDVLKGKARFLSAHEIEVLQPDGERSVHASESFLIATGSIPSQIPGSPSDGRTVMTSDEVLGLERIPASVAIVGSGAVGSEFAFIFTRLGVKVTLIEAAPRLFPAEDHEVDAVFRKVYERMGISVLTGSGVAGIEIVDGGAVVTLASGEVLEAEKVLVGVGRRLATRGLECEAAGVQLDGRGGVVVDEGLRTSQPHIYAAGDVIGRVLLAHAATFMGECAGRALAGAGHPPVPFHSIPRATFTTPEVGSVGMSIEEATRAGLVFETSLSPLVDNVKARIDRTTDGFMKIITERESGRIIGGTIVGPHASDLIHVIALAVHQRMTKGELRGFIFAHPTTAESIADLISIM